MTKPRTGYTRGILQSRKRKEQRTQHTIARNNWILKKVLPSLLVGGGLWWAIGTAVDRRADKDRTWAVDRCVSRVAPELSKLNFPEDPEMTEARYQEFLRVKELDGVSATWDGSRFIPWGDGQYIQGKIRAVDTCFGILGIKEPSSELWGVLSEHYWDPRGDYWTRKGFKATY